MLCSNGLFSSVWQPLIAYCSRNSPFGKYSRNSRELHSFFLSPTAYYCRNPECCSNFVSPHIATELSYYPTLLMCVCSFVLKLLSKTSFFFFIFNIANEVSLIRRIFIFCDFVEKKS